MDVGVVVDRTAERLRRVHLFWSIGAALVAFAAIVVAGGAVAGQQAAAGAAGVLVAAGLVAAGVRQARARWTPVAVAEWLEARVGGLDNLVVTAVAMESAPAMGSPAIREAVARQAAARVQAIAPAGLVPYGRPLVICAMAAIGAVLALRGVSDGPARVLDGTRPPAATAGLQRVSVTVTPAAYLGREPVRIENPDAVDVPAGSTVLLEVASGRALVWIADPLGAPRTLERTGEGADFRTEWVPDASRTVAITTGERPDTPEESRLLTLHVVPDQPPAIRIVAPGRDLAFTTPDQHVEIEIEADDAEGLRELDLRFVRLSGSGEAFTFAEGRVPIAITRTSGTAWRARARWSLASIGLDDGDSVVYRAVVRDSNPAGDPVASESFTIDIGARLEFAGAGFAVPDEDRRYAISQQMVIVKTERLEAERATHSAEEWATETRFLAMEQRMVRSEVVFLSGGEIEDEVEEAAHSHELQEGRLENSGRAEMLRAMNEMSRAEARLNDGDTAGALVFERAALAALQKAFDRRRYFLRTMPERSRIDLSRRLTGDRSTAESSRRAPIPAEEDALATERDLMADLARVAADGSAAPGLLAARLASLDSSSVEWQRLGAALSAADTADLRRAAAGAAMAALAERARARLAPATGPGGPAAGSLDGWLADEIRGGRPPR